MFVVIILLFIYWVWKHKKMKYVLYVQTLNEWICTVWDATRRSSNNAVTHKNIIDFGAGNFLLLNLFW